MKRMTLSFVVAMGLVILGIIGLIVALQLPLDTPITKIGGPGTFPVAFLVIIIAFSAILAVTEFIGSFSASNSSEPESLGKKDIIKILLMIAAVTVYMYFFRTVGFMISTTVLTVALLWLFGYKHIIISPVLAIGFTFALHLLFQTFLKISLP